MTYAFEEIDDTLDLVPLAARRALDRAGCKVSLDAWRESAVATRQELVRLGSAPDVDTIEVRGVLAAAAAAFSPIDPVPDPPVESVPKDLADPLGSIVADGTWQSLSPLDRYALAKVARKAGPSDKLTRAITEIAVVHEPRLSHLTARGEAHMVDVSGKSETLRRAVARATVRMNETTTERLRAGNAPKGDVLAAARLAGIQAAKRTPELIPLCHAIRLTRVTVDLRVEPGAVSVLAAAEAVDRTGVEMEALVAASTAALTVYDMLKGIDRGMTIEVGLERKSGGRTGTWERGGSRGGSAKV